NPFPTGNTAVIQSNMIGTGIDGLENYADHFIGQNPTAGINYPFYGVVSELRQGFTIVKNNVISGHTGTGLLLRVSTFDIKGNKKFGIKQHDTEYAPAPIITSLTASSVSGTSKPGAVIELFHTAECTLCEGKEYIASVVTDPDGKWLYHGAINKQVIATATFNNVATSEFSAPYLNVEIDESLEERKPASCNNATDGFIKHIKIKPIGLDNGPYTFTWRDASGTKVGSSLDLDGVP